VPKPKPDHKVPLGSIVQEDTSAKESRIATLMWVINHVHQGENPGADDVEEIHPMEVGQDVARTPVSEDRDAESHECQAE
jgi:hypothetical protein